MHIVEIRCKQRPRALAHSWNTQIKEKEQFYWNHLSQSISLRENYEKNICSHWIFINQNYLTFYALSVDYLGLKI